MSKVVVVKFTDRADNGQYNREEYRLLLQTGLKAVAEETNAYFAMKKIIPKGVIGMKTNCLTGRLLSTPIALTEALTEILTSNGHINDNNIIIWDRTNRELSEAGFKLNASSFGVRCLGTDTNGIGYDDNFETYGEVSTRISRLLTTIVDYNINLPILKDHSLAGLSAGLKNMYGAIFNPNKYHDNHCTPYAAHVSSLPTIKRKNCLTIIDAVRVQYNGGPGFMGEYQVSYGGLILSRDPVSADRIGLEIVQGFRLKNNLPPLEKAGRPVKYLNVGEEIGLGISDLSKINLTVLNLDHNGNTKTGELF